MIPRLKEQYEKVIVNNLQKKFSIQQTKVLLPLIKKFNGIAKGLIGVLHKKIGDGLLYTFSTVTNATPAFLTKPPPGTVVSNGSAAEVPTNCLFSNAASVISGVSLFLSAARWFFVGA